MVACRAFKDFLVDVTRDDVYVDGVKILDERGLPLTNAKTTQHWAQGFIVNESEKFAQKTIDDRAVRYYTVDVNPRAEIAGDIFSEFAQRNGYFDLCVFARLRRPVGNIARGARMSRIARSAR